VILFFPVQEPNDAPFLSKNPSACRLPSIKSENVFNLHEQLIPRLIPAHKSTDKLWMELIDAAHKGGDLRANHFWVTCNSEWTWH